MTNITPTTTSSGSKRVLEGNGSQVNASNKKQRIDLHQVEFGDLHPVMPEILDEASSENSSKLLDYRLVSTSWYSHCGTFLRSLWVALQNNPPKGAIDILVNMRYIIGKETDEGLSSLFRFKKLAHAFKKAGAELPAIPLPIRINDFQMLQNEVYDKALETIWGRLHNCLGLFPNPRPAVNARASEIRTFLNNPNNTADLAAIAINLDLSGLNLKVIPPELSRVSGIRILNLSNNKLREVPDFNLPLLTHLKLNHNQLRKVPNFAYLPNLTDLWLGHNLLKEIPNFAYLQHLTGLTLNNNLLRAVPDFNLPHLTRLALSNNLLREVPDFAHLPNLTHLLLHNNKLSDVPDFANLRHLIDLALSQNQLSLVPNFNLPQLTKLHLSRNQLREVPDFAHLPNLTHLDLFSNLMSGVPNFAFLPNLTELVLESNLLRGVPDFAYLPNLNKLLLHNNHLIDIPNFTRLGNLTTLTLSNNWLSQVPNFNQLPNLGYLSLNNNLLSVLPDFVHLPQLTQLFVNGNVFMEIPAVLFRSHEWTDFFNAQRTFVSQSFLAQFFQMILLNMSREILITAFSALDQKDKNLIMENVSAIAGKHVANEHIFDDMTCFGFAVQKAILKKFDSLSPEKKKAVYEDIYVMAGKPSTQDSLSKWGDENARKNLPRLADALSRVN